MEIYCHEEFNEKVSIILNELFNDQGNSEPIDYNNFKKPIKSRDAKT